MGNIHQFRGLFSAEKSTPGMLTKPGYPNILNKLGFQSRERKEYLHTYAKRQITRKKKASRIRSDIQVFPMIVYISDNHECISSAEQTAYYNLYKYT